MLADRSQAWLSTERLHLGADSAKYRDPQQNIRWSLGALMEELGGWIEDTEGDSSTGRPTEATGLSEVELSIRSTRAYVGWT